MRRLSWRCISFISFILFLTAPPFITSSAENGEWKDGLPEGSGVYSTADGSTYAGQFRQGEPHGHGQFLMPSKMTASSSSLTASSSSIDDDICYEGEYQSGLPHGRGKCCYRGGIIYDGEWKSGRRDGQGTITYPNKSQYVGGFRRGQMHGHGTFTSPTSGLTYSGEFRNGYVSGEGCLALSSGATITKNWPSKDDIRKTGRGRRKDGQKTVIEAIEHMLVHDNSGQT